MFELLFNYLELFQKIPSQDKETICQNITFRKVQEGEILLQEGKVAKQLFFICKGILKIVSIGEKGNEVIHFFLNENQFCTISKSFTESVPGKISIELKNKIENLQKEINKSLM